MNYDDAYVFSFTSADYDVDYRDRDINIKSITYSFWTLDGSLTTYGVDPAAYETVLDLSRFDEIGFPAISLPREDVSYEVEFYM